MSHVSAGPRCLLTRVLVTPENDSEAHIIPSALGGRLKPKGLLTRAANDTLNLKIDLPLIKQLAPLMTLLGIERDRGSNQLVPCVDPTGRRYLVSFADPTTLGQPEYSESIDSDGSVRIEIKARTQKEARVLLKRVKKKYPKFDTDAALQNMRHRSERIDQYLRFSLNLGPAVAFPAAYTMLALFAADRIGYVPAAWAPYVMALDTANPDLPPDTFFFYPGRDWLTGNAGQIAHTLVLKSDPARHVLFGYVELFGIICVGAILTRDCEKDIEASYRFDLLEQRKIDTVRVESEVFRGLNFLPADQDVVWREVQGRFKKALGLGFQRSRDAFRSSEIGRIINEVLAGFPPGAPLDREVIGKFADRLVGELVVPQLKLKGKDNGP